MRTCASASCSGATLACAAVGGAEIGHLHGDRMADLPFPVRMREELVESGKAQLHHVLPQTGWVSYYLSGEEMSPGRWTCSRRITTV